MAFFVPVVRNGKWDIYPTRVRTTSTGSNSSGSRTTSESEKSSGGNSLSTSPAAAQTNAEANNRKVRFSRSMSQDGGVTAAMYRNRSLRASSDCGPTLTLSPTLATPNVMPRTGSLRGLRRSTGQLGVNTKSNSAPVHLQNTATKMCSSTPPPNTTATQLTGSRGSVSKFHSKLVDKIKRRFRIKDDDGEGVSGDEGGVVRTST